MYKKKFKTDDNLEVDDREIIVTEDFSLVEQKVKEGYYCVEKQEVPTIKIVYVLKRRQDG